MARAVRKVSRTSTKNQKKESSFNLKWFIITLVAVLVIGLGVGLGVYFGTRGEEEYVSDKIYFVDATKTSNGENEVTFTKENYQTIVRYINSGNNIDNIFIFTYDGNAFYADPEDADNYNEDYDTLITRLADLQYAVNQAKEKGVIIDLYIVDVSVDSSVNVGIVSDSDFGALNSGSGDIYSPTFIYMSEGDFKSDVTYTLDGTEVTRPVSTGDWEEILSSSIGYAINFINSLS